VTALSGGVARFEASSALIAGATLETFIRSGAFEVGWIVDEEAAQPSKAASARTIRRVDLLRPARISEFMSGHSLVPTVLRGNAVFDALRRLGASPCLSEEDAERPGLHSHAERGNE
jgi:hypothetical protein